MLTFADFNWHVVWTDPGCERRVFRELYDLDLSPYLPRSPDGSALYRGYCFIRADAWRPREWDNVHEIEGVRYVLHDREGQLARVGGMQLESAIMGEILNVIRSICPSDPLFISRRKQKQEARFRQYLARKRAA